MDVADREGAEEALRASERFRTLLQFFFDVYWETDAQHRFTRQDLSGDRTSPTRRREAWRSARRAGRCRTSSQTRKSGGSTGRRSMRTSRSAISSSRGRRPTVASATCRSPDCRCSTEPGASWVTAGSDGTSPTGSARRRLSGRARHISPRLSGCDCWRHAGHARCRTRVPDRAARRNGQAPPRRRASRSRQNEESRRILRHRRRQAGRFERTLVALVTRLDPSRANRPVLPDAVALTH